MVQIAHSISNLNTPVLSLLLGEVTYIDTNDQGVR